MPEPSRRAAAEAEDVADDSVGPGPPRLDSSPQEEEDVDAVQMEPTASSGAACIDGGRDNGERRRRKQELGAG